MMNCQLRFNKKERKKEEKTFTALSNAAPKPLTTSHRHVVTGNEHSCTFERTNQKLGKTFLFFMNSKRLDNRQIGETRECFFEARDRARQTCLLASLFKWMLPRKKLLGLWNISWRINSRESETSKSISPEKVWVGFQEILSWPGYFYPETW